MLEGAHIAGCRIETVAGRGGMGIVYRATQISLGRPVALKLIAPEHAADSDFRERFQRESRMAAAIDHPNVIPVYEAGEEDGRLYLVMRWVAGTDLHKLLRDDRPARADARRGDRQPGRGSAGRRARRRARAPRRQARQRPAERRPRLPRRLRAHAPRRHRHAADDRRPLPRHRRLHGAGAVPPRAQRRARRRLRARLRAVRGAHRRAAVPARDGAGDDARAPARPAAARVATRPACRASSTA